MNNTITITRKTRKLGWGYTCWTKTGDTPAHPDVTGTVTQILNWIQNDCTYQSLKSGGTYLSEQWFYNGRPIKSVQYPRDTDMLLCDLGQDKGWRIVNSLSVIFA